MSGNNNATTLGGALDVMGATIFNSDVSIVAGKSLTVSGGLNMSSKKITNLGTPTAATDAANMSYVDS